MITSERLPLRFHNFPHYDQWGRCSLSCVALSVRSCCPTPQHASTTGAHGSKAAAACLSLADVGSTRWLAACTSSPELNLCLHARHEGARRERLGGGGACEHRLVEPKGVVAHESGRLRLLELLALELADHERALEARRRRWRIRGGTRGGRIEWAGAAGETVEALLVVQWKVHVQIMHEGLEVAGRFHADLEKQRGQVVRRRDFLDVPPATMPIDGRQIHLKVGLLEEAARHEGRPVDRDHLDLRARFRFDSWPHVVHVQCGRREHGHRGGG